MHDVQMQYILSTVSLLSVQYKKEISQIEYLTLSYATSCWP
jgi:hypothetical protein